MDSKDLKQALMEADTSAASRSNDPAELADRVLATIRRRRITKTAAGLLVVLGTMGITLLNLPGAPRGQQIAKTPSTTVPVPAEDELARIRAEIDIREAAIQRMMAIEQQSTLTQRLTAVPSEFREGQLIEGAAAVMLSQADRLLRSTDDPQPAIRAYHAVITYFPEAKSAQSARQRVAQLNKAG